MAGKSESLEDVFRRHFQGVDPGSRDNVVKAYATARMDAGSIYRNLLRETGSQGAFGSSAEERKVRAAVSGHKDFPLYAAAMEKRNSAVRLIDSWGKEEARTQLEAQGIDVAKFKGDLRLAHSVAAMPKEADRSKVASRNVLKFPEVDGAAGKTKEKGPRAPEHKDPVENSAIGNPAEWYHVGAVIETAGGRRIAVMQAWSESRAVVVALGEGKEVPVEWTRLPSPSDRMVLSLSPLVPNNVTAGDFGFAGGISEPAVEAGAVVQPVDIRAAEPAIEPVEGAATMAQSDSRGRAGLLGAPGEPIDAGRINARSSSRPFSRLVGASAAVGVIVLSVGTFSFMWKAYTPEETKSAALAIGSTVQGHDSAGTDGATGTKPAAHMAAAAGTGRTTDRSSDVAQGADLRGDVRAKTEAAAKPVAEHKGDDHPTKKAHVAKARGNDESGSVRLLPGQCGPAKVEVVIGGQKVMATTSGCMGEDGQMDLRGGSRRADAELKSYGTALDAAERRIEKTGLTRAQARMLREGAESDPRKQAMLDSRPGVAEAVEILAAPRSSTREDFIR